jgi:prevent-host-death family protein
MDSPEITSVTAADISRNFGQWQDRALRAPVVVTHHGRPRVVVISAELYSRQGTGPHLQAEPSSSEIGLHAVLGAMSEAFAAFDDGLRLTGSNLAFDTLVRINRAQLLGRSWSEIFPAARQTVIGENLKRAGYAGELVEFEAYVDAEGERRGTMRAFPYPGGVGLIAINRSEELNLRRRLSEKASFKAAFSGLHEVATLRLNSRGVIIGFDERFEEISGFQANEVRDCRLSDIFRPIERRKLGAIVERLLQNGAGEAMPATLLAKDGQERPLELSLAPIDMDGATLGLIVAARVLEGAPTVRGALTD